MSRPVLSVAAIAAGFLLVGCDTSGTRIQAAGVSATFQAQRFAFDNAAGIANEIGLQGFPTSGTTLYASTISPKNKDSMNPRNTIAVVLPPNCIGARPGDCKVRNGDDVYSCSNSGSALYCDLKEAGKSTRRLTYAVDGRFAMAQGGFFLSGVWYQGQSQKNQRARLFAEMARLYDAAFARNLDNNLAEASRLHREDKRRRQDAIAVVTGVAAGLSGEPAPRTQTRPTSVPRAQPQRTAPRPAQAGLKPKVDSIGRVIDANGYVRAYNYCRLTSLDRTREFVSAAFSGSIWHEKTYGGRREGKFMGAWRNFIEARYSKVLGASVGCFSYSSMSAARSARDRHAAQAKRQGRKVTFTSWGY